MIYYYYQYLGKVANFNVLFIIFLLQTILIIIINYEVFEKQFELAAWIKLEAEGANRQRPLMASTGVKDPNLPDTLYVTELVAQDLVNTMPEKTMEAVFDHGVITGNTSTSNYEDARSALASIEALGMSYDEVVSLLEQEGVDKFVVSWNELVATVSTALDSSK